MKLRTGYPPRQPVLSCDSTSRLLSTSLANLTEKICTHLSGECQIKGSNIPLLEAIYAAPKYGSPSQGCLEAVQLLARTEGILLDPVYTGKAFYGLLDLVKKGQLGSDEPIIFWHTGGLPALFAFNHEEYFE